MKRQILAVLTFVLLAPGETIAQSSAESRIQKLEETIKVLESRIAQLESQLQDRAVQASVPAGKEGWRKLKDGMSEADVERLLGSPDNVSSNSLFISWTYRRPSVGFVQFDAKSRKVESWIEP